AYGLAADAHGVGPLLRLPAEMLLVIRVLRYGKVMHAGADAARVHGIEEIVAGNPAVRLVHHDGEEMIRMPGVWCGRRGQADRQVRESLHVPVPHRFAALPVARHAREL